MKNRAIFIDKDGTLIKDVPYNVDPELITLQPGAREAVMRFKNDGYLLIIVSNQSGVSRGYFCEEALIDVAHHIHSLLDVTLDGFYFCPHHPDGKISEYAVECVCRKPEPGMLLLAAKEHNIDIKQSWMIGDILNDVEAGNRAGCKTILLDTGNETEWIMNSQREPDFIVRSWKESADVILKTSQYA